MSDTNLKPCPFCGGPNIERVMLGIECADCGARVPDDLTWNRREPEDGYERWLREAAQEARRILSEQP